MTAASAKTASATQCERVAKYAAMFSAMGTEPRLIMQLLLTAHPEGLVVSQIQGELEIPNSTLSHHVDKLKTEAPGGSAAGEHLPALYRQHRSLAGIAAVPPRGVLHPDVVTRGEILPEIRQSVLAWVGCIAGH